MMRGRIGKEYRALVWGWPDWDARTVDAPLLRQGEKRPSAIWLKRTIHPDGAAARTRLETLRRFERDGGRFALVRAAPETGRLHQIRVHLAHAGHPVVGDKIYGPDQNCYLALHRDRLDARPLAPPAARPPRAPRPPADLRRGTRPGAGPWKPRCRTTMAAFLHGAALPDQAFSR